MGGDIVREAGKAADALFTSDAERMELEQRPALAQNETNKIEAAHNNVFVAGWRPFIGWICGCGLGYVWFIRPLLQDIYSLWIGMPRFAPIDTDNMMQLIIALLGLGGLRTYEKLKGKTK